MEKDNDSVGEGLLTSSDDLDTLKLKGLNDMRRQKLIKVSHRGFPTRDFLLGYFKRHYDPVVRLTRVTGSSPQSSTTSGRPSPAAKTTSARTKTATKTTFECKTKTLILPMAKSTPPDVSEKTGRTRTATFECTAKTLVLPMARSTLQEVFGRTPQEFVCSENKDASSICKSQTKAPIDDPSRRLSTEMESSNPKCTQGAVSAVEQPTEETQRGPSVRLFPFIRLKQNLDEPSTSSQASDEGSAESSSSRCIHQDNSDREVSLESGLNDDVKHGINLGGPTDEGHAPTGGHKKDAHDCLGGDKTLGTPREVQNKHRTPHTNNNKEINKTDTLGLHPWQPQTSHHVQLLNRSRGSISSAEEEHIDPIHKDCNLIRSTGNVNVQHKPPTEHSSSDQESTSATGIIRSHQSIAKQPVLGSRSTGSKDQKHDDSLEQSRLSAYQDERSLDCTRVWNGSNADKDSESTATTTTSQLLERSRSNDDHDVNQVTNHQHVDHDKHVVSESCRQTAVDSIWQPPVTYPVTVNATAEKSQSALDTTLDTTPTTTTTTQCLNHVNGRVKGSSKRIRAPGASGRTLQGSRDRPVQKRKPGLYPLQQRKRYTFGFGRWMWWNKRSLRGLRIKDNKSTKSLRRDNETEDSRSRSLLLPRDDEGFESRRGRSPGANDHPVYSFEVYPDHYGHDHQVKMSTTTQGPITTTLGLKQKPTDDCWTKQRATDSRNLVGLSLSTVGSGDVLATETAAAAAAANGCKEEGVAEVKPINNKNDNINTTSEVRSAESQPTPGEGGPPEDIFSTLREFASFVTRRDRETNQQQNSSMLSTDDGAFHNKRTAPTEPRCDSNLDSAKAPTPLSMLTSMTPTVLEGSKHDSQSPRGADVDDVVSTSPSHEAAFPGCDALKDDLRPMETITTVASSETVQVRNGGGFFGTSPETDLQGPVPAADVPPEPQGGDPQKVAAPTVQERLNDVHLGLPQLYRKVGHVPNGIGRSVHVDLEAVNRQALNGISLSDTNAAVPRQMHSNLQAPISVNEAVHSSSAELERPPSQNMESNGEVVHSNDGFLTFGSCAAGDHGGSIVLKPMESTPGPSSPPTLPPVQTMFNLTDTRVCEQTPDNGSNDYVEQHNSASNCGRTAVQFSKKPRRKNKAGHGNSDDTRNPLLTPSRRRARQTKIKPPSTVPVDNDPSVPKQPTAIAPSSRKRKVRGGPKPSNNITTNDNGDTPDGGTMKKRRTRTMTRLTKEEIKYIFGAEADIVRQNHHQPTLGQKMVLMSPLMRHLLGTNVDVDNATVFKDTPPPLVDFVRYNAAPPQRGTRTRGRSRRKTQKQVVNMDIQVPRKETVELELVGVNQEYVVQPDEQEGQLGGQDFTGFIVEQKKDTGIPLALTRPAPMATTRNIGSANNGRSSPINCSVAEKDRGTETQNVVGLVEDDVIDLTLTNDDQSNEVEGWQLALPEDRDSLPVGVRSSMPIVAQQKHEHRRRPNVISDEFQSKSSSIRRSTIAKLKALIGKSLKTPNRAHTANTCAKIMMKSGPVKAHTRPTNLAAYSNLAVCYDGRKHRLSGAGSAAGNAPESGQDNLQEKPSSAPCLPMNLCVTTKRDCHDATASIAGAECAATSGGTWSCSDRKEACLATSGHAQIGLDLTREKVNDNKVNNNYIQVLPTESVHVKAVSSNPEHLNAFSLPPNPLMLIHSEDIPDRSQWSSTRLESQGREPEKKGGNKKSVWDRFDFPTEIYRLLQSPPRYPPGVLGPEGVQPCGQSVGLGSKKSTPHDSSLPKYPSAGHAPGHVSSQSRTGDAGFLLHLPRISLPETGAQISPSLRETIVQTRIALPEAVTYPRSSLPDTSLPETVAHHHTSLSEINALRRTDLPETGPHISTSLPKTDAQISTCLSETNTQALASLSQTVTYPPTHPCISLSETDAHHRTSLPETDAKFSTPLPKTTALRRTSLPETELSRHTSLVDPAQQQNVRLDVGTKVLAQQAEVLAVEGTKTSPIDLTSDSAPVEHKSPPAGKIQRKAIKARVVRPYQPRIRAVSLDDRQTHSPATELRIREMCEVIMSYKCDNCNKHASFLCSECRGIAYCSKKCQLDAWLEHGKICEKNPVLLTRPTPIRKNSSTE